MYAAFLRALSPLKIKQEYFSYRFRIYEMSIDSVANQYKDKG
jgi:hypothetical protein